MEFRFDACLYLKLGNKNSDAGHIKCSRGPQVPHPWCKWITKMPKKRISVTSGHNPRRKCRWKCRLRIIAVCQEVIESRLIDSSVRFDYHIWHIYWDTDILPVRLALWVIDWSTKEKVEGELAIKYFRSGVGLQLQYSRTSKKRDGFPFRQRKWR